MTTAQESMDRQTRDALARNAATTLRRWLRRHDRWTAIVEAAKSGDLAGYDVRKMPSKASKHNAYSQADRLIRLLELDVDRPSTVSDLRFVLTLSELELMA